MTQSPSPAAEQAIRAAVDAYYAAMNGGNGDGLRAVFDPAAAVHGWRDGAEMRIDLETFIGIVEGSRGMGDPRDDCRIEAIDICGPVAVVRVHDWFRDRYYTDFLTLSERNGRWIIVHKGFVGHAVAE